MDLCTLCKKPIQEGPSETWNTSDGQAVHIPTHSHASTIAETSLGEFTICESCYLGGLPAYFTAEDLAMVHWYFGLEYGYLEQWTQSLEASTRALRYMETADILATMACAESSLDNKSIAINLYERALALDPTHFIAFNNLKQLRDE